MICQVSFFQFYTPEILRFWGCGTPNGSLWTIVVELQFYLLVPVLFYLIKKNKYYLIFLVIASILANIYIGSLNPENIYSKLGRVFILPYLYYFIFGILTFIYWHKINGLLKNKFKFWFLLYLLWSYIFNVFLQIETYSYWIDSPINLISDFILLGLTFSAATSHISFSDTVLKGVDISYGVYIYHMVIINLFITYGFVDNFVYLILALALVIFISYLSYVFIEKPCLKLKMTKLEFLK